MQTLSKIKTTGNSKCGKDTEQWDSNALLPGMQNGTTSVETLEHCLDGEPTPVLAVDSHSTARYLPETYLNTCPRENLDINMLKAALFVTV